MRKTSKILFVSIMVFSMMSLFLSEYTVAENDERDVDTDVKDDDTERQLRANERMTFRFRKRTMLTIKSNVNTSVKMECDALAIGDKDFEIEVDADEDIEIIMECNEEQVKKGLQNGNTVQVKNQNRHRYQNGFVISIESNESCDAELKMEETEENEGGIWAYYDKSEDQWIAVETTEENGYLVCETDHFSTWTILTPEDLTPMIIVGIGIGVSALVIVGVIVIKKRKAS